MIITKNINLGYVGEIKGYKGDLTQLIRGMDTNNISIVKDVNLMDSHTTMVVDCYTYLVFPKSGTLTIYKQLPLINNDSIFYWKETKANGRLFYNSVVDIGEFRFRCGLNMETGIGTVCTYIRRYNSNYAKLRTIYINDKAVDNEAFIETIDNYIKEFKESINGSVSI